MKVDSIQNGIVIDHIAAGRGMQLYHLLQLDELDCPVAIMKNVTSQKTYTLLVGVSELHDLERYKNVSE